jgi:hypothetical protein
LPLIFIKEFCTEHARDFGLGSLLYFTQNIFFDEYEKICSYQNDISSLNQIYASNYKNFKEALNDLVGIEVFEKGDKRKECLHILVNGFNYHNFENFDRINSATLDYIMSGEIKIDREKLWRQISFSVDENEEDGEKSESDFLDLALKKCEKYMKKIIEESSEDQIKRLLFNWTGASIINHSSSLDVIIDLNGNRGIHMSTCAKTLRFHHTLFLENIMSEDEIKNILLNDYAKTMLDV